MYTGRFKAVPSATAKHPPKGRTAGNKVPQLVLSRDPVTKITLQVLGTQLSRAQGRGSKMRFLTSPSRNTEQFPHPPEQAFSTSAQMTSCPGGLPWQLPVLCTIECHPCLHACGASSSPQELAIKNVSREFLLWFSRLRTQLVSMRTRVQSVALLRGLRIQRCHKLRHRSQMWPGSSVAVAVV